MSVELTDGFLIYVEEQKSGHLVLVLMGTRDVWKNIRNGLTLLEEVTATKIVLSQRRPDYFSLGITTDERGKKICMLKSTFALGKLELESRTYALDYIGGKTAEVNPQSNNVTILYIGQR